MGSLEVLLLRRSHHGVFGGIWVFPGGQVETRDLTGAPATRRGPNQDVDAARRAAVREAREEAGLELDEQRLVTLSFWLPPPSAPRRFATWFFLAPAGDAHPVVVDDTEILEHRWQTPMHAMAMRNAGEIDLVPPTFTTLWWVSHHRDVASALAAGRARAPERFMTRIVAASSDRPPLALWEGDAGYADGDVNRPGPRRRLWLDSHGWRVEMTV
jgi:8-oxo-dGTP pyrophosphatase MutT (NUDIX family)